MKRPEALHCPQCNAAGGRPVEVESRPTEAKVGIKMRCESCAHEWTLARQEADPLLYPKPDRRKNRLD